jgi:hypothetical protein
MADEQLVTHEMNPETGKLEEVPVEDKPKKARGKKLPPKAPPPDVAEKRREMVASLLARGMRQIEIVNQLGAEYIIRNGTQVQNPSYLVNPITNQPFDRGTINRDVQFLRKQWRESAAEDMEDLLSRQLAEFREARRVAWARGDIEEVRLNLVAEMKLTGTARPEKKEVELGPETRSLFTREELEDLTDEQLAAIAASGTG